MKIDRDGSIGQRVGARATPSLLHPPHGEMTTAPRSAHNVNSPRMSGRNDTSRAAHPPRCQFSMPNRAPTATPTPPGSAPPPTAPHATRPTAHHHTAPNQPSSETPFTSAGARTARHDGNTTRRQPIPPSRSPPRHPRQPRAPRRLRVASPTAPRRRRRALPRRPVRRGARQRHGRLDPALGHDEVDDRAAEQRRVAQRGRKVGACALAQPPRDRRASVGGLAREPLRHAGDDPRAARRPQRRARRPRRRQRGVALRHDELHVQRRRRQQRACRASPRRSPRARRAASA